jgi:GNAT superfamily N-acetyltransferase
MTGVIFHRRNGEHAIAMLSEITDFYEKIRSEEPEDGTHDLFTRQSFISRTTAQAEKSGFELVTAVTGAALTGFSFGYPLSPGQWWGECTPAPDEVLNASKFAVIELNVRKEIRRQGIGKRLLGELLGNRGEQFATLATSTGSEANLMYLRWGWRKVGYFVTPPPMDALVISLPLAA